MEWTERLTTIITQCPMPDIITRTAALTLAVDITADVMVAAAAAGTINSGRNWKGVHLDTVLDSEAFS